MQPNQRGTPRWTWPSGEDLCDNREARICEEPTPLGAFKKSPAQNTSPTTKKDQQTSLSSLFPAIVSGTSQFFPIRHRSGRGGEATKMNKDSCIALASPRYLASRCPLWSRSRLQFCRGIEIPRPRHICLPLCLSRWPPFFCEHCCVFPDLLAYSSSTAVHGIGLTGEILKRAIV